MRQGWKEVTIGSLGKVITGNTPPKNDKDNYGGQYPFIKPTDMDVGRKYVTNWEENYSDKAFKRYKNSYIPPKATGVVTIGTVGEKMFQADQWCFTNQSVNVIIPNKELYDEDFIFYLMKINLPKVENANPGTASGRHHVSKSNFCAIKVRVPEDKTTQQKIATILSAYDDLIENNLKRIKLLEEMAQQTYEEWFVRMRFPGYETAVMNEETGLPDGWEKVKLGDYIDFFKGKKVENLSKIQTPGTEKVLLLDALEDGEFNYASSSNHILVDREDILMLMDGARSSYVFKAEKGIIGSTMAKINVKIMPRSFLFYYFRNNIEWLQINNTGAAIPHANTKFIKKISFKLPNESLLQKWTCLIKPIDYKIWNLRDQNQRLKEARDILLPRLMSGMIDLDELDVENEFLGMVAEEQAKYN